MADADTAVCWGPGCAGESWVPICCFISVAARAEFSISWITFRGRSATWWKDLGNFTDWPEGAQQTISDGTCEKLTVAGGSVSRDPRDEVLLGLRQLRAKYTAAHRSLAPI